MTHRGRRLALDALRAIRRPGRDDMFWWKGPPVNFGDLVGPYLYRRLSGRRPRWRKPADRSLSTVFVTAGSLGRWIREDSVVWGTGLIRREETLSRPAETRAVRGPLTRERFLELGIPCPAVYGDPGILLPRFYRPEVEAKQVLGVIPHYVDMAEARALFAGRGGVYLIDVRRSIEAVVDDIASCSAVVSSSLHGLLTAHAYGVPAAWVEFSGKLGGDGTKFLDYYQAGSVRCAPQPHRIRGPAPTEDLERLAHDAPMPCLGPLVEALLAACPFPRATP